VSRSFSRRGDVVRASFSDVEVELLRSLHAQLDVLLEQPDDGDPVIRRLFPPPVLGDDEVQAEVRSLLLADLLASRRAGLEAFVELLDRATPHRSGWRVELRDDEPLLVLGVLNDIRLAIGASVDIDAIDREQVVEDDPMAYRLAVMDHLAWLQEQLLELLDPPSVEHRRHHHDLADEQPGRDDDPTVG
jgi:hypothetical protein